RRRNVAASSSVRVLSFIATSKLLHALCSSAPSPIEALAVLRRGAAADLVHRQILRVRRDEPAVAEGILDPTGAVAVELIRHRLNELCSGRNGALDRAINVFDIEVNQYRRAADCLRAERLDLG